MHVDIILFFDLGIGNTYNYNHEKWMGIRPSSRLICFVFLKFKKDIPVLACAARLTELFHIEPDQIDLNIRLKNFVKVDFELSVTQTNRAHD